MVVEYRKTLPQTGTLKLYEYLQPKMKELNIKMGRDSFNELLRSRGMLIKKTKRFFITTDSKHMKPEKTMMFWIILNKSVLKFG
jgi:hypothetical protein